MNAGERIAAVRHRRADNPVPERVGWRRSQTENVDLRAPFGLLAAARSMNGPDGMTHRIDGDHRPNGVLEGARPRTDAPGPVVIITEPVALLPSPEDPGRGRPLRPGEPPFDLTSRRLSGGDRTGVEAVVVAGPTHVDNLFAVLVDD